MKKFLKRTFCAALCLTVAGLTAPLSGIGAAADSASPNYGTALRDSILFYDANKCGPQAGVGNFFDWRGACHEDDGADVGLDLTGGYHDCGDHVKFGITNGYAASVLGWSYYRYKNTLAKTGDDTKLLQQLKYFTDYFLKCHPNANTFYYQVGDGNTDHSYWGPPEDQSTDRPTLYKADANSAASDVLGETAAALALMYLNYNEIDPAYSARCLTAAEELYAMGKANPGLSSAQSFYTSSSYKDDMAWAATWLYTITGSAVYLNDAAADVLDSGSGLPLDDHWTMCWDDMFIPAQVRLFELTGSSVYQTALASNISFWENGITTTPGGLKYLTGWGVLRYSAAESMVALAYYEDTGDTGAKNLAQSQIDYILGNNPENMSYMIGYGSNWPLHPHHRAANGYTYANSGNLLPAKNLLLGGLVGGPDASDTYLDDGSQYQYTETGIDYDAGLVGALAGLSQIFGPADATQDTVMTPSAVTFDKSAPADISIPTAFSGNTLDNIVNGAVRLTKGTDYTVSNNAVVLKSTYLAAQPSGSLNLIFLTSGGAIPKFAFTIADSGSGGGTGGDGGETGGGSGGGTVTGGLSVQMYNGGTAALTNGITPCFRLVNTSANTMALSDIKLRYYYTRDGTQSQSVWCDWSTVGSGNVTGTFGQLSPATATADSYLEIGFTGAAGSLAPGASVDVQVRFSNSDWSNYTQSNDYSFNATATSYADWSKVAAYYDGTLCFGSVPQ